MIRTVLRAALLALFVLALMAACAVASRLASPPVRDPDDESRARCVCYACC